MNREIKFRVIVNNKIFGYEKLEDNNWKYTILEFNPDTFVRWTNGVMVCGTNKFIRQQYTGLKDKNGKEIYEGDIITYTPFNQLDCKNTIVKVHNLDKFHWFQDLQEMLEMPNQCDIEVIGNIFENPELLKK